MKGIERNYYSPDVSDIASDGTITMEVSGAAGGTLWHGDMEVKTTDPYYSFWLWVINEKQSSLINDEELEALRQEFQNSSHP